MAETPARRATSLTVTLPLPARRARGAAGAPRQIAERLGVRYVVVGPLERTDYGDGGVITRVVHRLRGTRYIGE